MFIVLVSHSNKTLHQIHKLVDKPCVEKVYLITIITPVSTVWNAATIHDLWFVFCRRIHSLFAPEAGILDWFD